MRVNAILIDGSETLNANAHTRTVEESPERRALLHDLDTMTVVQLRVKYRKEATIHDGILRRAREETGPRSVHPDLRSLKGFLRHMGPRVDDSRSVDRRDNSQGYEPDNVRWATPEEQARNRSTTLYLRGPDGSVRPLRTWAEMTGQNHETMRTRLNRGWSEEEVVAGQRCTPSSQADAEAPSPRPSLSAHCFPEQPAFAALFPPGYIRTCEEAHKAARQAIPPHHARAFTKRVFVIWLLRCIHRRGEAELRRYYGITPGGSLPAPGTAAHAAHQAHLARYRALVEVERTCPLYDDEWRFLCDITPPSSSVTDGFRTGTPLAVMEGKVLPGPFLVDRPAEDWRFPPER